MTKPRDANDGHEAHESEGDDVLHGELVDSELVDVVDDAEFAKVSKLAPRAGRELAVVDPLQQYMRDVQRYALLTPEDSHATAVDYVTTGNVDAAKKLVTANLRLVVKIAFDYKRAYRNVLDLIQEGNIGLMQAVSKYDPYRGVKLSSYAAWWIRAYILRFILNNWRLVKLGTTQTQRKLFFNLKKEKAKLSAMGIEPTSALIAQRLDVPEDEVTHMDRRLSGNDVSFDAPVSNESGSASRIDLYPSSGADQDELLQELQSHALLSERIHEFGKQLTGKDAQIFYERLVADEPKTLQELGEQFGVSRERIRQIEKRLQNKIRAYLEDTVSPELLPSGSGSSND